MNQVDRIEQAVDILTKHVVHLTQIIHAHTPARQDCSCMGNKYPCNNCLTNKNPINNTTVSIAQIGDMHL